MGAPRKYPQELMDRGVRMVLESGRPVRHVAGDLGIHPEALRMWVKKARADAVPQAVRVLPTGVEAELKALRERNAELERSNQILKEATALFAAELDRRAGVDPHRGCVAGKVRGPTGVPRDRFG